MVQYESALMWSRSWHSSKKMANFSAVVKNVDNYVKDKRNRIINCA